MKSIFLITTLVFGVFGQLANADAVGIDVGMSKKSFLERYPKTTARTYREDSNSLWFTYDRLVDGDPGVITFHLTNDKLSGWRINDRDEVVREYMSEFCSQAFGRKYPKMYEAISNVLRILPDKEFLLITNRDYPVIFTEYHYSGSGRFASSGAIINFEDDPSTFEKGLYMIKLSAELNEADVVGEIEGVVAHELAHRVLEHASQGQYSMAMEQEANRLVIKWGMGDSLSKAKNRFGSGHKKQ